MAASPFWNGMPHRIKPASRPKGIAAHPLLFWAVVVGVSLSGWVAAAVAFNMAGAARAEATSANAERKTFIAASMKCLERARESQRLGLTIAALVDLRNFADMSESTPDRMQLFNEAFDKLIADAKDRDHANRSATGTN